MRKYIIVALAALTALAVICIIHVCLTATPAEIKVWGGWLRERQSNNDHQETHGSRRVL